jgi:hypothetical protein
MTDDFQTLREGAERRLRRALVAPSGEISAYPSPISGCDAQFNHLLAERRRLNAALLALGARVFIPTPRSPVRRMEVESR